MSIFLVLADYMSSYEGVDYTSRPVVATKDGAVNLTLGEALQQMLPDALQLPQQQSDASEPGAESDVQAVESGSHEPVVTSRDKQQRNFKPLSDTSTVIVAGIQPSLQTSLAWLYDTLHAPDMFLYIVVITAP